jgi:hypothetical protein
MSIEQRLQHMEVRLSVLEGKPEPVSAPAPVEDWSGLPGRWKGRVGYDADRSAHFISLETGDDDSDAFLSTRDFPTREEAIAAIPGVVNAARCLEGLPVISLPEGLPDGFRMVPIRAYFQLEKKAQVGWSILAADTNEEMLRLYAWHLALPPATAVPAREGTDADLPEGYGVSGVASAFMFCRCGVWSMMYPTRPAAIRAAIDHAQAWREADRG